MQPKKICLTDQTTGLTGIYDTLEIGIYNIQLKKLCTENLNIDFKFDVYDLMASSHELILDNNKVLTTRRLLYLIKLVSVPCKTHDKCIRKFILDNYHKTENEENYKDLLRNICPWC